MCRLIVCRGQPPLRVLLACDRSCCYGLSHFLQLTFPLGLLPCSYSLFVHFILYTPSLTPQRQPLARAVIHSLILFHSTHFTFRVYVFSHPANQCGCSRVPFHSTPLHHRTHTPFPFIRSNTLHSLITSSPCSRHPQRSGKKMRQTSCRQHPSTALHAFCVRGTRSTRIGSHTTHRLHTSFRFTSLACSLAIHARSRLFFLFGLNLLLPRQPPTTHP